MAGQTFGLQIDPASRTNTGIWTLLDPTGRKVDGAALSSDDSTVLSMSGRYTLLIEGNYGASEGRDIDFSISLGEDESFNYVPGTEVNSTFASVGDRHVHTFSLTESGRYSFFGSAPSYQQSWEIRGREGALASHPGVFPASGNPTLLDLEAGDYQIVVRASGTSTSSYSFTLAQDGPFQGTIPSRTVQSAAIGDILSGTINQAGHIDRYDFELTERTSFFSIPLPRTAR